MSDKNNFNVIALNLNKYKFNIENYIVKRPSITNFEEKNIENCDEIGVKQYAKQCIWVYLDKNKLEELMKINKASDIRQFIDINIHAKNLKGIPRLIFLILMCSVTKFCKISGLNLEKTGAVLSQFYLTHILFTSALNVSAEKLFQYFKELTFCHCLPFPPDKTKLFSIPEAKNLLTYFCKLYLKNLPVIRLLSLPNLGFCVDYKFEETPLPKGDKNKKGKKDKKKKKK